MTGPSNDDLRVGFVGLGSMGEAMASNLLASGLALRVHDLRPEVLDRMANAGATTAANGRELGEQCDVVVVAVLDDEQVLDVCCGDDGLLRGLAPGSVVVVTSTIAPRTHRAVAMDAAAHGVVVLDAPMVGGAVGARDGTLILFVGGPVEALERVRPVLEAMSREIFHCGGVGSGAVVKIVNNLLSVLHIGVAREAIRLTRAMDLDGAEVLRMLNTGELASSWATRNWDRLLAQEAGHTTGREGYAAMVRKDVGLVASLAEGAHVDLPLVRAMLDHIVPSIEATGFDDV